MSEFVLVDDGHHSPKLVNLESVAYLRAIPQHRGGGTDIIFRGTDRRVFVQATLEQLTALFDGDIERLPKLSEDDDDDEEPDF